MKVRKNKILRFNRNRTPKVMKWLDHQKDQQNSVALLVLMAIKRYGDKDLPQAIALDVESHRSFISRDQHYTEDNTDDSKKSVKPKPDPEPEHNKPQTPKQSRSSPKQSHSSIKREATSDDVNGMGINPHGWN